MDTAKPFAEWIGRESRGEDIVTDRLVASFRAVFEPYLANVPEGDAPLGVHWCLSPAIAAMDALGDDGHPAKNLHVPPIPQPRRMWAGGTLEIIEPLRIGDRVTRTSRIADVTRKEGRSGELWFLAVDHEYATPRGLAIRERHDIVYREAVKPGATSAAEGPKSDHGGMRPEWRVATPPTLLFRYSAITFNGHRIHYDYPYVTEVEGYRGLVVHGPLQATLLLNLAAHRAGGAPGHFQYRGLSPAIAGSDISFYGRDEDRTYWSESGEGTVHMQAKVS